MSAPTAVDFQASEDADNRRVATRTFLMLAATARCGTAILSVRIRNVSETGALIEGEGLPPVGEPIHLSRGDTEIDGVVAWAADAAPDHEQAVQAALRWFGEPDEVLQT